MTHRFYVTYDICHPKRLRRVFKIMKGCGQHVQLSVFCCDLSPRQKETLLLDLGSTIQPSEDQVLFIDLGPTDGLAADLVSAIGRPHAPRIPGALVL